MYVPITKKKKSRQNKSKLCFQVRLLECLPYAPFRVYVYTAIHTIALRALVDKDTDATFVRAGQ